MTMQLNHYFKIILMLNLAELSWSKVVDNSRFISIDLAVHTITYVNTAVKPAECDCDQL